MGQSRPFLFIFVLFKHKFYRKTVDVSGIRTLIIGVEGEHADHLITTTAPLSDSYWSNFMIGRQTVGAFFNWPNPAYF